MAIGSEKERSRTSLIFRRLLKDFGLLGSILGELFGLLEPYWGGHGASWTIFGAIVGHLKLY